jgi:hypothetical protein
MLGAASFYKVKHSYPAHTEHPSETTLPSCSPQHAPSEAWRRSTFIIVEHILDIPRSWFLGEAQQHKKNTP